MPQKSLATLLQRNFKALTMHEQGRVLTAVLRVRYTPFHILFKRELPQCGVRCRDGRSCQAKGTWDAETGCFVRNGRCRLQGASPLAPRTVEGKRRIGEAARWCVRMRRHPQVGKV
jgi:hypothetical protein